MSRVYQLIRARLDAEQASEREGCRRCGVAGSHWAYYLRRGGRRQVIPLWFLEKLADGLDLTPRQVTDLKQAALDDAGWGVTLTYQELQ